MPAEWKRKAEAFRLPYWDWAQKLEPPSQIMKGADLKILTPDGKTETVKNPFLDYAFHPVPDFSPEGSPTTFRNPTFTNQVANEVRRNTLFVLNRTNSWDAMSNDRAGAGPHPELASSLEQIHNGIHNRVGGFMGDVPIAGKCTSLHACSYGVSHCNHFFLVAFDPIFWYATLIKRHVRRLRRTDLSVQDAPCERRSCLGHLASNPSQPLGHPLGCY